MDKEHDCIQEEELQQIKNDLVKQLGLVKGILVVSAIFTFLVGATTVQSTRAVSKVDESTREIHQVKERVGVQDEKFNWIQKAIERIEKKLDTKNP